MATTPNLDLNLPTVGANRDTWGALLNENFTTLDQSVSMAMPIGAIIDFAGPTAPPGWLIADGRLVSRTTYAALFAVIGTYWGAGDGSTTFALPPTPGRASVGPGTVIDQSGNTISFSFTQLLGSGAITIQQTHLPNYAMATDTQGIHWHTGATTSAGGHTHTTDQQGSHNHGGYTAPGANHTHTGSTDTQGSHNHNVSLPASAAAAAFGAVPVMTTTAGNANYTTDMQGLHSHGLTTAGSGNLQLGIPIEPSHWHNVYGVGDHTHLIVGDGNHAHNVMLGGGGQELGILNPVICVTKIIYAGQEATARVLTAAAAPTRRLSAPLRGSH